MMKKQWFRLKIHLQWQGYMVQVSEWSLLSGTHPCSATMTFEHKYLAAISSEKGLFSINEPTCAAANASLCLGFQLVLFQIIVKIYNTTLQLSVQTKATIRVNN